jgi:hypothetical protein
VGRIRRHLSYANVAATLALVFAMSGVGYAASGGFTSGGKLQACVNEEGTLKLLKAGKHCKTGQKAVSWNQTGRAGPKGAPGVGVPGAAGATGASGAAGPKGETGEGSPTLWAKVDATGNLLAGHGAKSAAFGNPEYEVTFDRNITGCGIVATQNLGGRAAFASEVLPEANGLTLLLIAVNGEPVTSTFTVVVYC